MAGQPDAAGQADAAVDDAGSLPCRVNGMSCSNSAECCGSNCNAYKVCVIPFVDAGCMQKTVCASNSDCCDSGCLNGRCVLPDGGLPFPPVPDGGLPFPPVPDGGLPFPPVPDGGLPVPPAPDGG